MIIPNVNPVYRAADIVLSEVKSVAEQLYDRSNRSLAAASTLRLNSEMTDDLSKQMVLTTMLEVIKNEIFYPEDEEKIDW